MCQASFISYNSSSELSFDFHISPPKGLPSPWAHVVQSHPEVLRFKVQRQWQPVSLLNQRAARETRDMDWGGRQCKPADWESHSRIFWHAMPCDWHYLKFWLTGWEFYTCIWLCADCQHTNIQQYMLFLTGCLETIIITERKLTSMCDTLFSFPGFET